MNEKWRYRLPFIIISGIEFLYALRYFADDDRHGWNGLQGLEITIMLLIPTVVVNLITAALTIGKPRTRATVQVLLSIAIFVYYWNNSLH